MSFRKPCHMPFRKLIRLLPSPIAKGDFYLLGVQIRLLTRGNILDVASFLHPLCFT